MEKNILKTILILLHEKNVTIINKWRKTKFSSLNNREKYGDVIGQNQPKMSLKYLLFWCQNIPMANIIRTKQSNKCTQDELTKLGKKTSTGVIKSHLNNDQVFFTTHISKKKKIFQRTKTNINQFRQTFAYM